MTTLLIAEHDNASIKDATNKALSAATALGAPVHILVAGSNCRAAADAAAKLPGVEKVLLADAPAYDHQLAEPTAALIVSRAGPYDALVAASTTTGRNVMPRVAALLDVMQVSDIIKVVSPDTFERPIYAGNAIQTVQSGDSKKVITVRTAAFPAVEAEGGSASVETVNAAADPQISTFKGEEIAKNDRPELTSARIIISGGRSLGSSENFTKYIEPIADKLGAAMGASRAAVDAGYAPNDWQVGQTGKVVAPDLYIAVGISGAIQHLAGMKDSKVIVAINKDEEAPIFQVADYGLVGDLFTILPELEQELTKAGR
jgi:electron transfer flavoprotein alpha subunit